MMLRILPRRFCVLLILSVLTACTSVPKDYGIGQLEPLLENKTHLAQALPKPGLVSTLSQQVVDNLLAKPLDLLDAEKIALQKNPMLRANLWSVGVAEADYAQAGRLPNPTLSYEQFPGGEFDSTLLFDLNGLFLIPLRRQVAARRLEQARYVAAGAVLDYLADTRNAWIQAVSQRQHTELVRRAVEAAQTANSLTRQMSAIGHSSVLDAARSEAFLGELKASLSKQQLREGAARESLIRQLGLWGEQAQQLSLPSRLPTLPETPLAIDSIERQAVLQRLDVQMAKMNLEAMASNLDLTRSNAFISVLEAGPVVERVDDETERGFEIEWKLPIFDAGGVKNDKAKILFEQAQAQAEATTINAVSRAREAMAGYQSAWEIARFYQRQLLPLRQRISQEQLLRYNGMLISVFDLLDDAREATGIAAGYVDATRDFWLADTALKQALIGNDNTMTMNFDSDTARPSSVGGEAH